MADSEAHSDADSDADSAADTVGGTDLARTFGVEEELLIVDPDTGEVRAVAAAALRSADGQAADDDGASGSDGLEGELMQQQLETGTRPCRTASDLEQEVRRWRARADDAARAVGARVVALPTSPLPASPELTDSPRYRRIERRFGLTAAEQLACGMHVHVGVDSDEEAVGVMDQVRGWLPVLLAMSAGSPYWQGLDTGHASFRAHLWRRWPCAGPTDVFGSMAAYEAFAEEVVGSGTVLDRAMLYLDVRPSAQYPTVEIRVADVCADADLVVVLACLVRALVDTGAARWRAGDEPPPVSATAIRLASWRAARSGLADELVDPRTGRPASAADVVNALLDLTRASLAAAGDLERVEAHVDRLLTEGDGAAHQRALFAEHRDLAAVVADALDRTHAPPRADWS